MIPVHRDAGEWVEKASTEPWPHVHLYDPGFRDDSGTVTVRLVPWVGSHGFDQESREWVEAWTYRVRPPGLLMTLWGDTLAARIESAALKLEERWREREALIGYVELTVRSFGRDE